MEIILGGKIKLNRLASCLRSRRTVNFQNNAQVQINAWFKLTPGYQAHCLQFMTLFLYFKRTPRSI